MKRLLIIALLATSGCTLCNPRPVELYRNAAENVLENDKEIVWRLYDEKNKPRYIVYAKQK